MCLCVYMSAYMVRTHIYSHKQAKSHTHTHTLLSLLVIRLQVVAISSAYVKQVVSKKVSQSCHSDVPVVLQWCQSGVTVV
jgi:hypothetical protein